MGQPEARVATSIRVFLESNGAFIFKVHGGPTMMNGLPDLIACIRGQFVGIEVKMPGNKPTRIQLARLAAIERAGGVALVAHGVDDVRHLVA